MRASFEVVILPVADPDRGDYASITLGAFVTAALIALRWPAVAMVLIVLCLVGYLRPDIPQRKSAEP